ncbi:MAG: aminoacyl-tRNA deacylase [Planctomycetota bacterium]|jgi:Ala-tRNA(Pro) deacylase
MPDRGGAAGDRGKEVAMPLERLKETLDEHHVKYETIAHDPAYTAQGIAATAHIPGQELAKTVMVKLDGRLAMCVLPATRKISFEKVRKATGSEKVELATEAEFAARFPSCEVGAMPPFGNLYDLDVFADESLAEDEIIAFNAGSHVELIRLAFADYQELVHPKLCRLCN